MDAISQEAKSRSAAAMILTVFQDDTERIDREFAFIREMPKGLSSNKRVPTFNIVTCNGGKLIPADTKQPHL